MARSSTAPTTTAQLVEAIGGDVRIVESSRDNLKITTPFDLRVAKLLLEERS
jgi:2-C-methyl-D-erythritol 4-phosphate cytidylyltransferase